MAMIKIDRRLRAQGLRSRLLLQIHDELVFEAPADEIPTLAPLVRNEMITALDLTVPLKVDLAAGLNWLDVEAGEVDR
jgi:DNA polymerase-1